MYSRYFVISFIDFTPPLFDIRKSSHGATKFICCITEQLTSKKIINGDLCIISTDTSGTDSVAVSNPFAVSIDGFLHGSQANPQSAMRISSRGSPDFDPKPFIADSVS